MQTIDRDAFLKMKVISERSLSDCNLAREQIHALMINHSSFERIDMNDASLNTTRFRECSLSNIHMNTANAVAAVFRLCQFKNLSAIGANFQHAKIENCAVKAGDFSKANLESSSLIESDISRSSFERANLTNTNFEGCNLRGTEFRGATIKNTSFRDADLRGADFSEATIESADFTGADLRGAIFDAEVEKAVLGQPENSEPPTELVNAVAPIVAKILKEAQIKGVVNGDHWNKELQQTLEKMGVTTSAAQAIEGWDKQIDFWLGQIGNLDVAELLNSLHSDNEKAPAAVANMLEGMVSDLELQQSASTAELFEALVAKLQKS